MSRSPDATPLGRAVARLAAERVLLVALDFDGTLAPFVDRPENARAVPAAREAVLRLSLLPHTAVAFVSGRPLDNLERVAEAPPGSILVGSHGAEVQWERGETSAALADHEIARLDALEVELHALADRHPGVLIERKPFGLGVHTRVLSHGDAADVQSAAMLAVTASRGPAMTARAGKDVLEFAIRDATKGDGLSRVHAHVGATAQLFAGDDVTDEDGFAVLTEGDIGIKVGEGDTRADFRVADPDALAEVLAALAAQREAACG